MVLYNIYSINRIKTFSLLFFASHYFKNLVLDAYSNICPIIKRVIILTEI